MRYQPQVVIGLMSGTSVDGLDAACCQIAMAKDPDSGRVSLTEFEVLGALSHAFDPALQTRLLALMQAPCVSLAEVGALNMALGNAFGALARALAQTMGQRGINVDFVASHGQTVGHFPPESGGLGSTIQLGEPSVIAHLTKLAVVADFRPADMAVGGHGAPLVPFADLLLFGHPTDARAVQNIGGIANMTVIPAGDTGAQPLAFDCGPGNMAIDAAMRHFFGRSFDADGAVAASGTVNIDLLQDLMADPYLLALPPKSTGRERFGAPFVADLIDRWPVPLPAEDWVATLTQFTVDSIVQAYQQFVLPQYSVKTVIVGGGGVKNATMMAKLDAGLAPLGVTLTSHEAFGMDSQYKEAAAFALLGYARWMGLHSNIPACTGAREPALLGGIWASGGETPRR